MPQSNNLPEILASLPENARFFVWAGDYANEFTYRHLVQMPNLEIRVLSEYRGEEVENPSYQRPYDFDQVVDEDPWVEVTKEGFVFVLSGYRGMVKTSRRVAACRVQNPPPIRNKVPVTIHKIGVPKGRLP